MAWFGATQRWQRMDAVIRHSFGNLKQDMHTVFQWLDYLHQQNQAYGQQIEELKRALQEARAQLRYMPKTGDEVKRIIDSHYSFEPVLQRIAALNQRVDDIVRQQKPLTEGMTTIAEKVAKIGEKKESVKEKMVKQLTRNSKRYVKNIILSLIQKYERIAALQLREMVVDEQGLCSKSSFYRLLGELEKEDIIDMVQEGKEKLYLFTAAAYNRKR